MRTRYLRRQAIKRELKEMTPLFIAILIVNLPLIIAIFIGR